MSLQHMKHENNRIDGSVWNVGRVSEQELCFCTDSQKSWGLYLSTSGILKSVSSETKAVRIVDCGARVTFPRFV